MRLTQVLLSFLLSLLLLSPTSRAFIVVVSRTKLYHHLESNVAIKEQTTKKVILGRNCIHFGSKLFAKKKKLETKDSKISDKRRRQLGIGDNEDEYDLSMALDVNTDSSISKIVAGSLILTILVLLVYGLLIPLTTDYGDGVCNPLLTQGRC